MVYNIEREALLEIFGLPCRLLWEASLRLSIVGFPEILTWSEQPEGERLSNCLLPNQGAQAQQKIHQKPKCLTIEGLFNTSQTSNVLECAKG